MSLDLHNGDIPFRAEKAAKFNTAQAEDKRVVEEKKQQKVELDERQRQEEEERRK